MTLEMIQQKVRELNTKTRRELLKSISWPICVVINCYILSMMPPNPLQRTLVAVALAWSLLGQYIVHRGMRPAKLAGDAGMTVAIESYRHEIERKRSLFGRGLLWGFGPVVLSLIALEIRFITNTMALPFTILVAVWIVSILVLRMQHQRELQREINELKKIEQAQ